MARRLDDETQARNADLDHADELDQERELTFLRGDFRRLWSGSRPRKGETEEQRLRSLAIGFQPAGES